jgi:hypothetical protein
MAAGWFLSLYPGAGEAGGSFRGLGDGRSGSGGQWVSEPDEGRALEEAARRARGKVRRYCAANGLNRFGTLTYAGEGVHDPRVVRADIAGFFRSVRRGIGEPFAYLWVPELHKTGHGWHVHFAVGRFVPRGLIESSWGRGFVFIKLIQGLPTGSGVREEARVAARYLSKYLGKEMGSGAGGLNRYDVAQGFQPRREPIEARTVEGAIAAASDRMGGPPAYVWRSEGTEGWRGPSAVWLQWR